jgi:hypothetical protein
MKTFGNEILNTAKSSLSDAKKSISKSIAATGDFANSASASVTSGVKQTAEFASEAAKKIGNASVVAGAAVKRSATTVTTTIFDQNGDGTLDQEDLKIITEKGIELSKSAAQSITDAAKTIAASDLVKETAGAAMVGAAISIPVPVIGPATGAVIGAALGAYSHLTKKK